MSDSAIFIPTVARIHQALRLIAWQPRGLLDAPLAETLARFIEAEEKSAAEPFARFIDLSGLQAIRLSVEEIEALAQSRIESYTGAPVKCAILALNPLMFGIARMYEQLLRHSMIEVRTYCRLTSLAAWLEMPIESLITA